MIDIAMARPLRILYPGALYHVTSRGNEQKPIYLSDQDRQSFLTLLDRVIRRYHWICHAYCLMLNHYHLLIETPDSNLSSGMRQLNGVYTQLFNRRHQRVGHLLQGRFKAILIQKESHLLEVCRYVVLNPVRSGLMRLPEQWRWSSYLSTAGEQPVPPGLTVEWVLNQFGTIKRDAEKAYRRFVRDGIGDWEMWEKLKGELVLGDESFVEKQKGHLTDYRELVDLPKSQRYLARPDLGTLLGKEAIWDLSIRKQRIREAVEQHGYKQREIADHLGVHFSTVSRWLNQYMPKETARASGMDGTDGVLE